MSRHRLLDTMKINMKLLPIKAHYFLVFAGTAPVLPFLPVYAWQQGISPAGIGLIYTVLPCVGLFSKTIFGVLSDWLHIHRAVFLSSILICALGFFSVYFTPVLPLKPNPNPGAKVELDCTSELTTLSHCFSKLRCGQNDFINSITTNTTTTCQVTCKLSANTTEEVCPLWNVSCPSDTLNFNTTMNLMETNVGDLCTAFPLHNVTIAQSEVLVPTCPAPVSLNCTSICDNTGLMMYLEAPPTLPPETYEELVSNSQFWVYLGAVVVAWCGLTTSIVMSDTTCFQLLGSEASKYGEQRLFGSIGWGLLVVVTGALIDFVSAGHAEKDYTPAFVLCVAILFLDLLAASRLQITGREKGGGGAGAVARLMFEPRVVLFVICCVVVGISTGVLWTFQLMLVEDVAYAWDCHFPAMKLLQGLIMGVQCFGGELPFFFLSGWFIRKLGHVHCMSLVIIVFGLRYIIYYAVVNPWFFLPVELLNGFTFGIFYATMTSYASFMAPPGTEATMQGIVGAAFEGIGVATGGLLGGSLYRSVGGSRTFLYVGVFNVGFTFLHIILQALVAKFKPQSTPPGGSSSPVVYMPPSDSLRPVVDEGDHGDDEEEEDC
ncbi:hypothetical protein Pmani_013213 [Petrolisthes manimaculis]|uniref:Major facilitator superfamily associated domain-containing protein n=1 Tax=Petrolisthes manimaculis TaxID=1843537 RepID=A0AAE1U9U1_9EUCA|nr:hypothetical protein Pmani_013213 [Petrolisthes manimaculis]